MISTNEPYFTHVKLQTSDFIKKSGKFIFILFVLNIFFLIIIHFFDNNFFPSFLAIFKVNPIEGFNILLLYEGGIFFVISPMTISIRPVKNMNIQTKDESPTQQKFFEGTFVDKILSHEFIVRKTNVYGLIGFIAGTVLIILSFVMDMIFKF